jgi:putative chitinase
MTPEQLVQCGVSSAQALRFAPLLTAAADRFGIEPGIARAYWLAQLLHESQRLTVFQENLNYSAKALFAKFGHRISKETAYRIGRIDGKQRADQRAIANHIYANRFGNGAPESGDGWSFRGKGPIQLTFRLNYRATGKAIKVDIEANPGLVSADPQVGCLVAAHYWASRDLDDLAKEGDLESVTKAINGGLTGLQDRRDLTAICIPVFA